MTSRSRRFAFSPLLIAILLVVSACGANRGAPSIALVVEPANGEADSALEVSSGEIEPLVSEILASPRFTELAYGGASENDIRADVATRALYEAVIDAELEKVGIDPASVDPTVSRGIFLEQLTGAFSATETDPQAAADEVSVEVSGYLDLLSRLVSKQTALGEFLAGDVEAPATIEIPCSSHILVTEEAVADDLIAQLADGADFGELAMEFSIDPGSGAAGGALGCTSADSFVPEFRDAVLSAPIGEVVGPVQTDFGFHIIVVTEIQEQAAPPVDPAALAAPVFEQALRGSVVVAGPALEGLQWDPATLRVVPLPGATG